MDEPLLDGILVIDLSEGIAGGYCCRLLAACGAQVVRVIPPGSAPVPPGDAVLLPGLHDGKQSITLDITHSDGAALLRRLAELAEAMVQDRPHGAPRSLGFDYETLSAASPRLVMTSIAPLGGAALWAADLLAGLGAFAATLAALIGVAMTERGQHVEIRAADCLAAAAAAVPTGSLDTPFRAGGLVPLTPAAAPGADNSEVYGEVLGLGTDDLADLKERGVI